MDNSLFNPLIDSLSDLSVNELTNKIDELSRKYFMSSNPDIQLQIQLILEMYNSELTVRQSKDMKNIETGDKSLDNLINIS
jgi:hypothetical protein|tara:strand:+ start:782 stop:1024 length:243 start_codon:yes stop_codon:yes gene_type:complete